MNSRNLYKKLRFFWKSLFNYLGKCWNFEMFNEIMRPRFSFFFYPGIHLDCVRLMWRRMLKCHSILHYLSLGLNTQNRRGLAGLENFAFLDCISYFFSPVIHQCSCSKCCTVWRANWHFRQRADRTTGCVDTAPTCVTLGVQRSGGAERIKGKVFVCSGKS